MCSYGYVRRARNKYWYASRGTENKSTTSNLYLHKMLTTANFKNNIIHMRTRGRNNIARVFFPNNIKNSIYNYTSFRVRNKMLETYSNQLLMSFKIFLSCTKIIERNPMPKDRRPSSCCPGSLSTPWPAWKGERETSETHHHYKLYAVSFILFLFFSDCRVSAHRGRIRTVCLPFAGQRGTVQVHRRSRPVRRVH